jgi:NAD(P)-dependent dehydrogenase (short-subunit alcohol dehydrogenase family)
VSSALAGRTAFITGGSGGLAGGVARALLRDGAAVLLMARGRAALEQRQRELGEQVPGARVEIFAGDACSETDVQAGINAAFAIQQRLDIVVPLAGGGSGTKPLLLQTPADLRDSFERNVVSVLMALRAAVPLMQPGGSIVCISSTAAKITFPWMAPYGMAKAAIESLVRSAAEELSHAGIRVNAVRPGLTRANGTGARFFPDPALLGRFQEQIPLLRPGIPAGEPDDIGAAVRYLAGPESSWVTGQSFAVDGGNEIRKAPDLGVMVEKSLGAAVFEAAKKGRPL